MAQSFLIFDFGENESAAQQARHRIGGWKQAFHLDKKLQFKFDRKESPATPEPPSEASLAAEKGSAKPRRASKAKSKPAQKPAEKSERESAAQPAPATEINLIVRLDFSDHEKLSHQSWLARIPAEEPFKTAKPKILHPGDPDYSLTADRFDSLD